MSSPTPLRVLLLEDEPLDAELILGELRRAGFAPAVSAAAAEPEFLAALDPDLDVILADYTLPQFDAGRALRHVQERGLDIPFIVVSGTIGEERAAAIIRDGATDYLLKDRLGRLGIAVRQAMRQRELRREKEQAEARFRAIVEHASDIALIVDAGGTINYASPATARVLGYPPEAAPGAGITDTVHPDDQPEAYGVFIAALARADQPCRGEFRVAHQDGSWRWIEATVSSLGGLPGTNGGVVVNARDVTERRRLDELRVEAAERAAQLVREREHARTLEELAQLRADFSAMVAHELGSRIAAIVRYADLLAIEALTPSQHDALATIQREAGSLRNLVADARASASVERDDFSVVPRPVPVSSLLVEAAAFAKTLPGDHPLLEETAITDRVLADPGRIGQVLRNLLSNASKYSPPGSAVSLRAARNGDHVRIEVADRGPGITDDDLPRVFEKFKRGRAEAVRRVPGVGLGLYLSRRIVQAHGTDLTVETTPGQGATFGFELEVAGAHLEGEGR